MTREREAEGDREKVTHTVNREREKYIYRPIIAFVPLSLFS
jgi:hypothetical protein